MDQLRARALDLGFEDGGVRSPLAGLFPKAKPVPSLEQALAGIGAKYPDLGPEGKCVKIARKQAKKIDPSHTQGMSADEIIALILYTMESAPREESLYFLMNAALRGKDRSSVKEWCDYIWLLLHAMRRIPQPTERSVYRGFKIEPGSTLKPELTKGADVTWSAFSSTASTVDVMSTFLGKEGERIMYIIELTEPIARDVKPFSLFPAENELLVPPNFSFEIVSIFDTGGGLTQVQCKQTETLDVLLDFGAPPAEWNVPAARTAQPGTPPQAQAQSAQFDPRTGQPLKPMMQQPMQSMQAFIPAQWLQGAWTRPGDGCCNQTLKFTVTPTDENTFSFQGGYYIHAGLYARSGQTSTFKADAGRSVKELAVIDENTMILNIAPEGGAPSTTTVNKNVPTNYKASGLPQQPAPQWMQRTDV